ncbi:hypothetical protein PACTADRAFT_49011, partial [Pachysolen tannophilus NRRL Y-2460]
MGLTSLESIHRKRRGSFFERKSFGDDDSCNLENCLDEKRKQDRTVKTNHYITIDLMMNASRNAYKALEAGDGNGDNLEEKETPLEDTFKQKPFWPVITRIR